MSSSLDFHGRDNERLSMERNGTSQHGNTQEVFGEKTMAIRQMMDEAEREFDRSQSPQEQLSSKENSRKASISMLEDSSSNDTEKTSQLNYVTQTKRRKSMIAAGSARKKPVFSRQPDLGQWDEAKKEKLFGSNKQIDPATGNKMSMSGVRQRMRSIVGSRKQANNTHHFQKPSLKRQTSYEHNMFSDDIMGEEQHWNTNQRTSMKSIIESDVNDESDEGHSKHDGESDISSNGNRQKITKIPKKKLALDPDKVKSKLCQSTNSSLNKMKSLKSSQTPQVKSISGYKIAQQKNWSTVKSKVDTRLFRLPGKKPIDDDSMDNANSIMKSEEVRIAGIKRKLSWSMSGKPTTETSNNNEPTAECEQATAKNISNGSICSEYKTFGIKKGSSSDFMFCSLL